MRPKLLTHPNIPKPLHGVNPRSVMGKDWWDVKRQEAYAKENYHCWACGCHKSQDKFHNWLEAHESYDTDYKNGIASLNEIVALCHSCHNFIHSGKLKMDLRAGRITTEKALYILKRGFHILKQAGLKPFHGTCHVYCQIMDDMGVDVSHLAENVFNIEQEQKTRLQQDWSKWHLVIDGKKHFGKFKSQREWEKYYR